MRILNRPEFDKGFESQFAPVCEASMNCDKPVVWYAWSDHGRRSPTEGHAEFYAYCCDPCKNYAIQLWKDLVGKTCACGYTVDGTIDQHMRFIRL